MPRTISWQSRLAEIHRQVKDSSRTPYTRADLEKLFRVKLAAAKALLLLMPRVVQANATVVERQDLLDWIAGAIDAEDVGAYLRNLRTSPPKASRRKIRQFVPRDYERGRAVFLPQHKIWLNRGELQMTWKTLDEFFSQMAILFGVVEANDFETRYCSPPDRKQTAGARGAESWDVAYTKTEIKLRECVYEAVQTSGRGDRRRTADLHTAALEHMTRLRELLEEAGREPDEEYLKIEQLLESISPAWTSQPPSAAESTFSSATTPPPAAAPLPLPELEDKSASS